MSIALKLFSGFVLLSWNILITIAWQLIFLLAVIDGGYCRMTTFKGELWIKSLIILGQFANQSVILLTVWQKMKINPLFLSW